MLIILKFQKAAVKVSCFRLCEEQQLWLEFMAVILVTIVSWFSQWKK